MEVIILAGGLGTRLCNVVKDVPKCMAPVAGKPFLWYLLKDLNKYENVTRVILSIGYLREVILEWIPAIQNQFRFTFDYAIEEEPLGTGGGIKLAMEKVTESEVVILNGDTYFAVNLNELVARHKAKVDAKLTIALKKMKNFDRYGAITYAADGRVLKFNEKKACKLGEINGGVYVLSKDEQVFAGKPQIFSFETEVMQEHCGISGYIYCVPQNGYFIDIGVPEDYKIAQVDFPLMFSIINGE